MSVGASQGLRTEQTLTKQQPLCPHPLTDLKQAQASRPASCTLEPPDLTGLQEGNLAVSVKTKMYPHHDLAIPLLRQSYPEEPHPQALAGWPRKPTGIFPWGNIAWIHWEKLEASRMPSS